MPKTFATSGGGVGSNSIVTNEVPSGTVDGSNATFTLSSAYVSGSTQVFRDGQLMKPGGADYTETTPTTGVFTFTTATASGSVIEVTYQKSLTRFGNADTVDGFHANSTPTASNILPLDSSGVSKGAIYSPQGFLINGKIVPSVSSNNLTVALKGMDGNDPSATNPVYVRIGSTIRSVTAALSVTKNAGTNWFNSGSSQLATNEIDYFVYLGFNATDGVTLGFARIPYAQQYSDFSTTTTDGLYAAISTITNAASTDEYNVVGRFAATLSATASFNWSVPTFTPINLIQRPIFETRRLTFTAVWTGSSVNPTTIYMDYVIQMNRCIIRIAANNGTSNATTKTLQLPIATSGAVEVFMLAGVQDNGSFPTTPGQIRTQGNTTTADLHKGLVETTWTASGTWAWFGLQTEYYIA